MANGLGLAGAGLADNHVPRQLVKVFAAFPVLLETGLEFLADPVQVGAPVRVADGLGSCRRLRLDGGGELFALAPGAPAPPEEVAAEEQQGKEENDEGDDNSVRVREDKRCADSAQAGGTECPLHQFPEL